MLLFIKNKYFYILCIPFGDIPELIGKYDYIPFTDWFWNINLKNFQPKKYDPEKVDMEKVNELQATS